MTAVKSVELRLSGLLLGVSFRCDCFPLQYLGPWAMLHRRIQQFQLGCDRRAWAAGQPVAYRLCTRRESRC